MGRHGTAIPGMLVARRHSRQIGAFLDAERQALRPLRPLGRGDRRRVREHSGAFPVLISHEFSPSLGRSITRSRPIHSAAAMTAAPARSGRKARRRRSPDRGHPAPPPPAGPHLGRQGLLRLLDQPGRRPPPAHRHHRAPPQRGRIHPAAPPLGHRTHPGLDHPPPPLRPRLRTHPRPPPRHDPLRRHHPDDPPPRPTTPPPHPSQTASIAVKNVVLHKDRAAGPRPARPGRRPARVRPPPEPVPQHRQALRPRDPTRTATARPRNTGPRSSIHTAALRKRRAEEPAVPVQQLLREIRELGYPGSSNLLVRYIT